MPESSISNIFSDSSLFGKDVNGQIFFKTDCSSWAAVAKNNLFFDKYLYYESHNPTIYIHIGFQENKKHSIKKPKHCVHNRLRTKRKKNTFKTKRVLQEEEEDENEEEIEFYYCLYRRLL